MREAVQGGRRRWSLTDTQARPHQRQRENVQSLTILLSIGGVSTPCSIWVHRQSGDPDGYRTDIVTALAYLHNLLTVRREADRLQVGCTDALPILWPGCRQCPPRKYSLDRYQGCKGQRLGCSISHRRAAKRSCSFDFRPQGSAAACEHGIAEMRVDPLLHIKGPHRCHRPTDDRGG